MKDHLPHHLQSALWEAQREAASTQSALDTLRQQHHVLAQRASLCAEQLSSLAKTLDLVTAELQAARTQNSALLAWMTGGWLGEGKRNKFRKRAEA
jgi:chromosome segregation ATPase